MEKRLLGKSADMPLSAVPRSNDFATAREWCELDDRGIRVVQEIGGFCLTLALNFHGQSIYLHLLLHYHEGNI